MLLTFSRGTSLLWQLSHEKESTTCVLCLSIGWSDYCRSLTLRSYLAGDELNHLSHGHARRETVGVHDEVGADARIREGHVLLGNDDAAHPLLSVSRRELVAHLV